MRSAEAAASSAERQGCRFNCCRAGSHSPPLPAPQLTASLVCMCLQNRAQHDSTFQRQLYNLTLSSRQASPVP